MSIEKITSKIISDAEAKAKVTLDAAKAECDGILAEAQTKADELVKKAEAEGLDEKEKLISRRKAVAEIDGRKIILEEKQKLISECFDKAVEKIANLEENEYVDFLVKLVESTGETDGEIIMNAKDAAKIGEKLVQEANGRISGGRITLSDKTEGISGGFLLRKGSVYINCSLEALVENAREGLAREVAEKLF